MNRRNAGNAGSADNAGPQPEFGASLPPNNVSARKMWPGGATTALNSRRGLIGLPYAMEAIAICRLLVGEVGTESEAGSVELLPVRDVR